MSDSKNNKNNSIWKSKEFTILLFALTVVVSIGLIFLDKENSLSTASVPAASKNLVTQDQNGLSKLEKDLENKLQATLSQMNGVGQVQVSVSLSSGLKSEFATNQIVTKRTSKETDKDNGTRETVEVTENNQMVLPNGASKPVMVMEERPEVAGVLVIAEGARDAKVKEAIHKAVRTLLDIPAGKISVETMGGV